MSGGAEDSTPQFPGAEYLKASQTCRLGGGSLPPNNQWNVVGALEFLSGKNFHGEPIGFAMGTLPSRWWRLATLPSVASWLISVRKPPALLRDLMGRIAVHSLADRMFAE
jgi:hypothetical protein